MAATGDSTVAGTGGATVTVAVAAAALVGTGALLVRGIADGEHVAADEATIVVTIAVMDAATAAVAVIARHLPTAAGPPALAVGGSHLLLGPVSVSSLLPAAASLLLAVVTHLPLPAKNLLVSVKTPLPVAMNVKTPLPVAVNAKPLLPAVVNMTTLLLAAGSAKTTLLPAVTATLPRQLAAMPPTIPLRAAPGMALRLPVAASTMTPPLAVN
jgi:hypothetical protein